MRNVLEEKIVEKKRILRSINFFFENLDVYEIMSKYVEPEGPQMTVQYGAYAIHAG
jgi:hypothetical protein